jgi:hypothetical protein
MDRSYGLRQSAVRGLDRRCRLGPRSTELLTDPLRERADDKVVRVFDQVAHELVGETAVERARVPVAFVEVIPGADRGIAVRL